MRSRRRRGICPGTLPSQHTYGASSPGYAFPAGAMTTSDGHVLVTGRIYVASGDGDVLALSVAWGGNTRIDLDVRPTAEAGAPRQVRLRAGANPYARQRRRRAVRGAEQGERRQR